MELPIRITLVFLILALLLTAKPTGGQYVSTVDTLEAQNPLVRYGVEYSADTLSLADRIIACESGGNPKA